MRVTDVSEVLHNAEVDPTYYSVGSERHEALCILAEGQTWHVFIGERGTRHEERTFDTEDAACSHFLKRIFELWRRK